MQEVAETLTTLNALSPHHTATRQVLLFFTSQVTSWVLTEVVICSKSHSESAAESTRRCLWFGPQCPGPSPVSREPPSSKGGTSWLGLPSLYSLQTGFPSTATDLLSNPVPFTTSLYFSLPPTHCSVSPGYWGNRYLSDICWISNGHSLSFPAPLSLLILSSLFKPACSNFPKHPISKCTEGTGAIIN